MRAVCPTCLEAVLIAVTGDEIPVLADPFEWEPRARCYVCASVENRGNNRANCARCGGEGYVGHARPDGVMLAIDIAWSDSGHVRLIGPNTTRKRGEALYAIHECGVAVAA